MSLRIGTWNVQGDKRRSGREDFLRGLRADVWLLTELPPGFDLVGYTKRCSAGSLQPAGQGYAAVLSIESSDAKPAGHLASATASVGDMTFVSSVLPWTSAKEPDGFPGVSVGDRTSRTLHDIGRAWPDGDVVWGGDWNHTLMGSLRPGSRVGTAAIQGFLKRNRLRAPTASLGSYKGDRSVNHIAVPVDWVVTAVERHAAEDKAGRLSDHDAYVVVARQPDRADARMVGLPT